MDSKTEKRQLTIFAWIAYGIPYLLGILMWYGYGKKLDLSAFPNAQMLYPAMGVMLAFLLTRREDKDMPKAFYRSFTAVTLVSIVLTVCSVLRPDAEIAMPGGTVSVWLLSVQYVQIIGSILCLVCLIAAGKRRRAAYGLRGKNWKASAACILLFMALYFLRAGISYAAVGELASFAAIMKNLQSWMYMGFMPVNFLLAYIAFFGEEYGWRYYLQPVLQKKFGLRKGVVILGIVWGLWHLPLDFFYYVSPKDGLPMTVSQVITCVSLGIFMGFAYMKTENIWVPVIMHFLNNNLILVISGDMSVEVLSNQTVSWSDIPLALLVNGVLFGVFIFAKEYRKKRSAEGEAVGLRRPAQPLIE